MNIQGVQVLSERIIYVPSWVGLIFIPLSAALATFFAMQLFLDNSKAIKFYSSIASIFFAILFCFSVRLSFVNDSKTIYNEPIKVQYDIEVTDEAAWKELVPKYTFVKKIYDTKEIYLIEGEYVND